MKASLEKIFPWMIALLMTACGSAEFRDATFGGFGANLSSGEEPDLGYGDAGPDDRDGSLDGTAGDGGESDEDANDGLEEGAVQWQWSCGAESSDQLYPIEPVIKNAGTYVANPEVSPIPLYITGEKCDQPLAPRDILFVFDASWSMRRNDPGAVCGRLQTIEAVAKSVAGNDHARFGLVTFSRRNANLVVSSGDFYHSLDDMKAAVARNAGTTFADAVCGNHRLGTNFDTGLTAAAELITSSADLDTSTEMYFVSDGKPLFGNDGSQQVNILKNLGVRIATVMVRGRDQTLKNMASRTDQGDLLYAQIDTIDALADTVTALSAIVDPVATIAYRPVGTEDWLRYELLPADADDFVAVPKIDFDYEAYPDGIEVAYTYYENHTQKTALGSMVWDVLDPPPAKDEPAAKPEEEEEESDEVTEVFEF